MRKEKSICLICKKEFYFYRSTSKGKYCSNQCLYKSRKGKLTYFSKFKGKHKRLNSGRTHFRKGCIPYNKGKKYPKKSGENHFAWKGSNVGYRGLHSWIERKLGKASDCTCKICGQRKAKHWANKDHTYKRNLTDWIQLCISCHRKYDKTLKVNST